MKLHGISDVASELGVAESKIRYYTTEFLLPVKRVSRNRRKYTVAQIEELRELMEIERLGLRMKLIREIRKDDMAMELLRMLIARLR